AVIIAVLLSRLLLQKIPKLFSYALWSIVLFRLVCPFSFESALSLLPVRANPIPVNIGFAAVPELDTGISILNNSVNALLPTATPQGSINPLQGWIFLGRCLWLIGIAALLLYSVLSLRKLRRALLDAVPEHGNVYTSASLVSPFVLGLFRPKIYLPAGLTPSEKQYILLHEQTHIKRFDHIVKLVSFFVLCLHWFNPLVWSAFFFSGRDMELSCDEAVIRCLGSEVKQDYSSSLLALATGKRIIGGTPLAFGEGDTKSRIQNVLHYKKPAFWVLAVSLLALAALSIGLMTNPIKSASSNASPHSAEELWAARTAYVGNNSAVSKLLSMLPLPQDLQHNHVQLHTSGDERGIEWVLDEAEHAAYSETELNQPALLLFALVDNLEDFDVTIQDPQGSETQLHYNRIWADNIVGGAVRDYAKSATALQDLMDRGDFFGQRDLRPMLMVDGVLYFDTNKKISAAIEDSAVLGKLRSSVAAT
ncbi:MAG: M56 family metallopeptidase, partial [Pygmaiobacter sp.]